MSINKTVIGVSIGLLVLMGLVFAVFEEKQEEVSRHYTSDITIEQTWQLPKILEEVSGIAWMGDNRIACIQDEDGDIFIYNLETSKITQTINFAGSGDYEGITLSGTTAYVLRSDGTVFKIENYESTPKVTRHTTPLKRQQDVEGLAYDKKNNRLLLAIKEKEPENNSYKGIYAVDPENMEMAEEPVFRLLFRDPIFEDVDEGKPHNKFKPSEININPATGEIYMLEGANPKLLILGPNGKPKKLRFLNKNNFNQPEGITFDNAGTTYVSNEGNPATIHRISLE